MLPLSRSMASFNQASSTYSILTAAFGEPGVARLPRAVLQNLKNRKNFYKISVHILYNQILKITKNHQNILVKSIGYKDNFFDYVKTAKPTPFFDFLRFCSFNIIFPFFLQIFCLWKYKHQQNQRFKVKAKVHIYAFWYIQLLKKCHGGKRIKYVYFNPGYILLGTIQTQKPLV